jgi:hypothetical protein
MPSFAEKWLMLGFAGVETGAIAGFSPLCRHSDSIVQVFESTRISSFF